MTAEEKLTADHLERGDRFELLAADRQVSEANARIMASIKGTPLGNELEQAVNYRAHLLEKFGKDYFPDGERGTIDIARGKIVRTKSAASPAPLVAV